MQPSLSEQLAIHLKRPVFARDRERARLHLLDWLGCIAGALRSPSAEIARKLDTPVAYRVAWLANRLEMDDVHRSSILHPGPVVWAASLAQPAQSMDILLDAAVRGYEATIAIGATFDERHYSFWHNTTTAGLPGAAVSALCIRQPDAGTNALADAMGLAASVSGGLWQMRNEHCDAKQWHIAHAVTTGTQAALASMAGARAPAHILEGPQGLHKATCSAPRPMSLDDGWRIFDVSFKPWGACRHAHPAIDAALELKARIGALDGEVTVETYADALTFCDRPNPADEIDAKFSLQHAIGLVATKGEPELADFGPEARAAMATARTKVSVREAAEFTERYPAHFGARVHCGGHSVTLNDTLGDPERPIGEDRILAKVRALVAWGGLPSTEADRAASLALDGNEVNAILNLLEDWLA